MTGQSPNTPSSSAENTSALTRVSSDLTVSLIGGANFMYAGREIGLRNRKARAMLAYLALSETAEEPRERLAGLLWSEFGEQNARATLRQAVHEVREAMVAAGCDALTTTRMAVGLRPGSFLVDVDTLVKSVAAVEAPDVLFERERISETLLAGLEDLDPSFHVWLVARRQILHDRLIRGLEDGYGRLDLSSRRRRRLAEAALLLDPTHEEACRVVMRCAAEAGEIGAALHAYDELYRLLGDEYDMEPSAMTRELVAEIKQGKFDTIPPNMPQEPLPSSSYAAEALQALLPSRRATVPAPPPPIPPKPALFIAPFAMSGVDSTQAHLVEGFRIELIASLIRFREWYISEAETDARDSPPVSARFALTTTAYQAGAAINVVMVLQERPSGLAIWGERFELRLDLWFNAQHRIVRRIASTLNVQLSNERLARISHVPDVSLEVYDIWLRGQWVIRHFNAAEWNRAVEMFAQGIERAPTFSPLYSSLAQMNNAVHFVQPGMFRDPENVARTLALARRAVALDPLDSRAELCLCWALTMSRQYATAEVHLELACELNTNDAWTLISAAMFHAFHGNPERARDLAEQAMEATPSPTPSHWVYEVSIRYLRGDYEGTLAASDRARDTLPNVAAWRAAAMAQLGRRDEAARELQRFYASARANWIGDEIPSDELIGRWLLQVYPISRPETWRRLRDALASVGMPVGSLEFPG